MVKRDELVESLSKEVRKSIAGAILFNLQVAERVGMNPTDLQCLNLLEMNTATTPGELAASMRLTTGGVTVVLDRLEKAKWIERRPNPKDRRSTLIRPLRSRLRKLQKMYQSKDRDLRRALAKYNHRDLALILEFFRNLNSSSE